MVSTAQKCKVLFLAEELRVGGAETYFYRLEAGIDRKAIDFDTMAVPSNAVDGLTHPERFSAYTFSPIDRIRAITRLLQNKEYDVVHANSLQLCVCAYFALRRAHSKANLVYTRHNKTALESLSESLYFKTINCLSNIVVAICETEKSRLISGGIDEAKICLINNAVDVTHFPFKQRFDSGVMLKPRIGILARISPEKSTICSWILRLLTMKFDRRRSFLLQEMGQISEKYHLQLKNGTLTPTSIWREKLWLLTFFQLLMCFSWYRTGR